MKALAYCAGCGITFPHYEKKCPQCKDDYYHWKCVCGVTLSKKNDSRCFQGDHPLDGTEAPLNSKNPWKY